MRHFAGISNRQGRGIVAAAVFAAGMVLGIGGVLSTGTGAEAAVTTFEVEMAGANEVPAAASPGSGFARFTFNDQTRELTYAVWLRGLSSNQVTASHIHRAPAGTAGPPVYTLAVAPFDSIAGSIMLTEADVADLRAGNLYVNIHSTGIPSGFARGQLRLPSASAISPPSTGDGGLAAPATNGVWQFGWLAGAGLAIGAAGFAAYAVRRS
ncbi:MAG TPA: CHRD domain-containing protein [Dehalococcoidia bacterium]|nr:CHRD domain-containing protein [Dehalococcoidia bacterium]